jgi:hypothetical protein
MSSYVYATDAELPVWRGQWNDANGTAIDLSSATFTVKLVNASSGVTVLTKTSGVVGTSDGLVTVTWATGELNVAVGNYRLWLYARTGTSDRVFSPDNLPTIGIVTAPT